MPIRAARYFACDSHAHLVSKAGSVISAAILVKCQYKMKKKFISKYFVTSDQMLANQ